MNIILLLLCLLATYFLWRDFTLRRIYRSYHHGIPYPTSGIREREFYETRRSLGGLFPWILRSLTSVTFLGWLLSISAFFLPARIVDGAPFYLLRTTCSLILTLYVVEGSVGRLFSYLKNYGSIDKTW